MTTHQQPPEWAINSERELFPNGIEEARMQRAAIIAKHAESHHPDSRALAALSGLAIRKGWDHENVPLSFWLSRLADERDRWRDCTERLASFTSFIQTSRGFDSTTCQEARDAKHAFEKLKGEYQQ